MVASKWIAAVSISSLGAQSLPPLLNWSKWSPADIYTVCQQVLKLTVLSGSILSIIDAPFGRFALPSSIFSLPGRLAFALMELPVLFAFLLAISNARPLSHDSTLADKGLRSLLTPDIAHLRQLPAANLVLGLLFFIHYLYRAIIQPARSPPRSSSHMSVFFSASLFSLCNGFTMGTWLGGTSPSLLIPTSLLSKSAIAHGKKSVRKSLGWLAGVLPRSSAAPTGVSSSPVLPIAHAGLLPAGYATLMKPLFLLGVLGWIVGFALNVYHDEVLLNLRKSNNQGKNKNNNGTSATQQQYYIPHGGLYKYISYPNYFTECEFRQRMYCGR